MKAQLTTIQSNGMREDMTKRLKKLRELQLQTKQMKEAKDKRKTIMKEVKHREKTRWVTFLKNQEQALKKEILQKKKITEKQVPKQSS